MPIQKRFGSCAGLGQMPMATLGVVVGQGGRSRGRGRPRGRGKDRAGAVGGLPARARSVCNQRSPIRFPQNTHRLCTGEGQLATVPYSENSTTTSGGLIFGRHYIMGDTISHTCGNISLVGTVCPPTERGRA